VLTYVCLFTYPHTNTHPLTSTHSNTLTPTYTCIHLQTLPHTHLLTCTPLHKLPYISHLLTHHTYIHFYTTKRSTPAHTRLMRTPPTPFAAFMYASNYLRKYLLITASADILHPYKFTCLYAPHLYLAYIYSLTHSLACSHTLAYTFLYTIAYMLSVCPCIHLHIHPLTYTLPICPTCICLHSLI